MALYLLLIVIVSIYVNVLQGELTGRNASGSSLPLCGWSNQTSTSGNCSSTLECHQFQTSTGDMICAPNTDCSYFHSCYADEANPCASFLSVCVTDSFCKRPVCMPIVLNSTCTYNQSPTTTLPTSITIVTTQAINVTGTIATTTVNATIVSTTISASTVSTTGIAGTTEIMTPATSATASNTAGIVGSTVVTTQVTSATASNTAGIVGSTEITTPATSATASNTAGIVGSTEITTPATSATASNTAATATATMTNMTATTASTTVVTTTPPCSWSSWVSGSCSVTCGTGSFIRQRFCRTPSGMTCTTCAKNDAINGTRPCFYPAC